MVLQPKNLAQKLTLAMWENIKFLWPKLECCAYFQFKIVRAVYFLSAFHFTSMSAYVYVRLLLNTRIYIANEPTQHFNVVIVNRLCHVRQFSGLARPTGFRRMDDIRILYGRLQI